MADERKPEKAMAGMLKRPNAWPRAAGGAACPDASTLAAYFERSLTATETAQCESHFSSCALCQEQLAALVRSEPAAAAKPAADRKPTFALAWSWRWMAPVGAAVVVLVFVLSFKTLYAPVQSPMGTDLMVRREPANQPPAASAPQQSAAATAEKSKTLATAPAPKALSSAAENIGKMAVDETKLRKEMAPGVAGRAGQELKDRSALVAGSGAGAIAGQPIGKPAEEEKNIPAMESRVVGAQAEAAKAQVRPNVVDRLQAAPAAAAPEQAKKEQQVVVEAGAQALAAPAPSQLPASKPAAARKEGATGQKAAADAQFAVGEVQQARSNLRAAPEELVVSTPKSGVLWRIKNFVHIERTQDGGKTWVLQKNPTQENILAASAASETVCWAGGSNGVLLRTTDGGENWEQMHSPTKNAIVSLKAGDQLVVTVVSADGHTYETRDAGAHWRAL